MTVPTLGTATLLEPLHAREIVISHRDEAELERIAESEVGGEFLVVVVLCGVAMACQFEIGKALCKLCESQMDDNFVIALLE